MSKINGTNLVVVVNGVCIAGCTSCSLNPDVNITETTSKDSAGWEEGMQTKRSWAVDFDALYDPAGVYSAEELIDTIINRQSVTIEFATQGTGNGGLKWSGTANLQSPSISAPMEDVVTISGTFKGTGPLAKRTVSAS